MLRKYLGQSNKKCNAALGLEYDFIHYSKYCKFSMLIFAQLFETFAQLNDVIASRQISANQKITLKTNLMFFLFQNNIDLIVLNFYMITVCPC